MEAQFCSIPSVAKMAKNFFGTLVGSRTHLLNKITRSTTWRLPLSYFVYLVLLHSLLSVSGRFLIVSTSLSNMTIESFPFKTKSVSKQNNFLSRVHLTLFEAFPLSLPLYLYYYFMFTTIENSQFAAERLSA